MPSRLSTQPRPRGLEVASNCQGTIAALASGGTAVTPEASPDTVTPLALPAIVTFPVEADISNAARMGAELFGACRPGAPVVIADLSLTEFCDSSCVRYLLVAHDQAKLCGGELRVVASAAVLRVLQAAEVEGLLRVHPTMGHALTGAPAVT
jgi:anti-anti-sigma regulatory factor